MSSNLIRSLFSFAAPYLVFGALTILTASSIFKKTRGPDKEFLTYVFVGGMLIRCYFAVLLTNIAYMDDHNGFISGDDRLYSLTALDILKDIKMGAFKYKILWFGINLYTYLLALFYSIFGFKLIASKFINCYIGAMTPVMAYFITARLSDRRAAKIVSAICVLYPSFVFWSTHNLKEPLIILSVLTGVWLLLKAVSRELKVCDILIFMLLALTMLNLQVMYVYQVGLIMLAILFSYCTKAIRTTALVCLIATGVLILFWERATLLKFILRAEEHQWQMAVADTAGYRIYAKGFIENLGRGRFDLLGFVAAYLKGLIYFLCSPFPWKIETLGQFFVLPQIVVWYALLSFSFIGITKLLKTKPHETTALIIFLAMGLSIWALTEGNIGAAFRHRDHFSVIIFICAAIGIINLLDYIAQITHSTESHGCKHVDEWLSAQGSAPRNPANKDAAAVKPWSFTDRGLRNDEG